MRRFPSPKKQTHTYTRVHVVLALLTCVISMGMVSLSLADSNPTLAPDTSRFVSAQETSQVISDQVPVSY